MNQMDWPAILRDVPTAELYSELGRRRSALVKTYRGGPKVKPCDDPELAERRRKKREAVAKWRANKAQSA